MTSVTTDVADGGQQADGSGAGAPDPQAAMSGTPTPTAGRFPWGLVAAPIALAALAGVLWWYVSLRLEDAGRSVQASLTWDSLSTQITQHLSLTGWSTFWVLLVAVPLGVLLTRPIAQGVSGIVLAMANAGQAIPALGLFVLLYMWAGRGSRTAILALVIFILLPILRNTMVGLQQVPADVIESARGMGYTRFQVLRRIELPLAVPVILAGVRTALVINVGMATLAVFVSGGGLGETIMSGIRLNRHVVLMAGAGTTALLALTIDWLAAVAQRVLRPRGL